MEQAHASEDTGGSAARYDVAKDQWGSVIRAQIHFNEAIQRTRQLTATIVLATFGASAAFFATHPHTLVVGFLGLPPVHVTTPVIILGLLFLGVGYLTDHRYYYRMLVAAVQVGEAIERDYGLPAQ